MVRQLPTNRNDEPRSEQILRAALSCWPGRDDLRYRRHAVPERLLQPDLFLRFPVPWMDDGGRVRVDQAFIAAHLPGGPCRGDYLFRPGLTEDELLARTFLFLLESRLCPPAGGALLCGVTRDPSALSDGESMRLCRSLRERLERYAPPLVWTPGAELPDRERGYLGLPAGGRFSPGKAAGYGLCFFAGAALRRAGRGQLSGKTLAVRGHGPVAEHAAALARRLGAQVSAEGGADVIFLCDDIAPLDEDGARSLIARQPAGVFEGVPLACTPETAAALVRAGLLFVPALAAVSGAVASPEGDQPRSPWETERRLRLSAEAMLRTIRAEDPDDLCRGAIAAALRSGAEALLRGGV